jgi:hypothetical protein
MADWVSAISSSLSALAAVFSFLAFLSAMKMQREDSINDVRPELLLLDWSTEDKDTSSIGPYTRIKASKIKNVGRGPVFDLWCLEISPRQSNDEITSAILACPYIAAGMEEAIDVGFLVKWSDEPVAEQDAFVVRRVRPVKYI